MRDRARERYAITASRVNLLISPLRLNSATARTRKELPMPIQPRQPTAKGPAEWFTGDVFIDPIARGEAPSRVRVSAVRFTPGARTAWHAHAVGQTLYVTEGRGLVQSRGGAVEEIRAGDLVSTPPDEWHWHGAAPDHYMTHLSITEAPGDERPEADWGEHVTDDEYAARPATDS
jgi:quercetin dioxygenase-like cupin family protein